LIKRGADRPYLKRTVHFNQGMEPLLQGDLISTLKMLEDLT